MRQRAEVWNGTPGPRTPAAPPVDSRPPLRAASSPLSTAKGAETSNRSPRSPRAFSGLAASRTLLREVARTTLVPVSRVCPALRQPCGSSDWLNSELSDEQSMLRPHLKLSHWINGQSNRPFVSLTQLDSTCLVIRPLLCDVLFSAVETHTLILLRAPRRVNIRCGTTRRLQHDSSARETYV